MRNSVLEFEICQILEECITSKEYDNRNESIDNDRLPFLGLLFIASRCDIIIPSKKKKEYSCRSCKKESKVRKLSENPLSCPDISAIHDTYP